MGKQYTDRQVISFIRSNLRRLWMISSARGQALEEAETAIPKLDKNGNHIYRTYKKTGKVVYLYTRTYTCQCCGKDGMKNNKYEMSVDHTDPAGPTPWLPNTPKFWTWDIFITRLLWPIEVKVLCKECHDTKTIQDRKDMKDITILKKIVDEFKNKPKVF